MYVIFCTNVSCWSNIDKNSAVIFYRKTLCVHFWCLPILKHLNHEYNLIQYFSNCFQSNFYKCRTRQNYFLSCNLSGPPVFQCHITQWQFSCIEFFFFLIFAFVYVHLACRCHIVWKINLFFSHIFACACAFL